MAPPQRQPLGRPPTVIFSRDTRRDIPRAATPPAAPAALLPLILASGALAGACYLLLILIWRDPSSGFPQLLWQVGVGLVLLVPVAGAAAISKTQRGHGHTPRVLAMAALLIYTAFWIVGRASL